MVIKLANDKLSKFTSTIMADAAQETREILKEVQAARHELIQAARERLTREADHYWRGEQDKIRAEAGLALSRQLQQSKRELALFRAEITESVLRELQEKLTLFTADERYSAYLERQLSRALDQMPHAAPFRLKTRACDVALVEQLARRDARCADAAVETADIRVGGLIVESTRQKIRADMTLDTALDELKDHVAERIGLSLDDDMPGQQTETGGGA